MADEPNPALDPATKTPTGTTPPPTNTTPPDPNAALVDGTSSALDKALGTPAPKDPAPADPKDAAPTPDKSVPEKYAAFTLPEGVTLDEATLGEASALFRTAGLDQETAQKFVDIHTKATKSAVDSTYKLWHDTQATWLDELNSDPVIGKQMADGTVGAGIASMLTHLPVEQAAAFRQAMNYTGAGNHPAIVRALYALSKSFKEPAHVPGGGPVDQSKSRPSPAQALYPTNPTKG